MNRPFLLLLNKLEINLKICSILENTIEKSPLKLILNLAKEYLFCLILSFDVEETSIYPQSFINIIEQ